MDNVTALDQYRIYLEFVDRESETTPAEEYIDLLAPGEVADLLVIRDLLLEMDLTPAEQREIQRLDDLLVKHCRLIVDNIGPRPDQPRERWWWHLHEGPQVREEALAAARER